MNLGLEQGAIDRIVSVFNKHSQVERVLIYGSRAEGDFRNGSNIDLTLLGEDLSESPLSSIKSELDDLNTP